jgi:hypothetical protein
VDNGTRWVGIDLHRRRSFVTAINEQGELSLQRRIVNDREAFLELLGDPDGTHVALEATYGWEWLADLLEDAGFELHLAHPGDRSGEGQDRRGRRQNARSAAARRAVARGLHRSQGAARCAGAVAPPGHVGDDALGDQEPGARSSPGTASPTSTQICSAKPGDSS